MDKTGTGRRVRAMPFLLACAMALCAPLLLSACAGETRLRRAELGELAQWLPGRYDNRAQVEADRARGVAPPEALALAIVPIYAPIIGDHVFYVQEMAADNAERVIGQRLLSLDVSDDERIVQSTWALAEPLRWRSGHLDPNLFKSLMPQDVRPSVGCELFWKREADKFVGANDPARCRAVSRTTGATVLVSSTAELGPDELALSERTVDASKLPVAADAEPMYRFRRSGP